MKKRHIFTPISEPTTLDFVLAKSGLNREERERSREELEFAPSIEDFKQDPGSDMSAILGDGETLTGEFLKWVENMVTDARGTLWEMYTMHGVLPQVALQILGREKARQLAEDDEIKKKLRSLKKREKDAAQIKKAVKLALKWLPYAPQRKKELDRTYRAAGLLSRLGDSLPKLGPSQRGRRKRPSHVVAATCELSNAFEKLTGRPHYSAVRDLLQKALPDDYYFWSERDLGKMVREARKENKRGD